MVDDEGEIREVPDINTDGFNASMMLELSLRNSEMLAQVDNFEGTEHIKRALTGEGGLPSMAADAPPGLERQQRPERRGGAPQQLVRRWHLVPARQAGAPVAAGECEFFADGCEDWGPLAAHAAHHAGLAAALAWPYWRGLVARGERHGAFRRLGKS